MPPASRLRPRAATTHRDPGLRRAKRTSLRPRVSTVRPCQHCLCARNGPESGIPLLSLPPTPSIVHLLCELSRSVSAGWEELQAAACCPSLPNRRTQRSEKLRHSIYVVFALLLLAGPAGALPISFGALSGANADVFSLILEDGYTVTSTQGVWREGHLSGNPTPSIFSSSGVAQIEVVGQAASTRPSMSAAMAKEKAIEKPT